MVEPLLVSARKPSTRFVVAAFTALSAVPVIYILTRVFAASRNIAFWDDYDSTLAYVLRLDAGTNWRESLQALLAVQAEHRTVTSRLIVAAIYWVTGTVNFNFLSALGNLSFLGLGALLIASAGSVSRRVTMGVVLAFGLFQLEHYEPFLWSGASIDHFQILLLAGGAIVALTRPTRGATLAAGGLAVLATFTLAHGCAVWPVGALMLWHAKRRRALMGWCVLGALALAGFFSGFEIASPHRLSDVSPLGLARLVQFWLALLGGPLTFGTRELAPCFGLGLLGPLGWLLHRRAWSREPVAMPLALFAVASLALIAYGRFAVAGPRIDSRYLVVGSLAWSLTAFMLLENWSSAARPFRLLAWSLPALMAFNVAASVRAASFAETFLTSRDYPLVRFKQFGEEGHAGGFRLHPGADTAKKILAEADARNIYRLPRLCDFRTVPSPQPNPAMVTYVTDLTADDRAVGFEGWAMFPERKSQRGEIHVVLRSSQSYFVLSTFNIPRPDVATAFKQPLWRYCGYNFVTSRSRLPAEDFRIGLLITDGTRSELKMTDHWLKLSQLPGGSRALASNE